MKTLWKESYNTIITTSYGCTDLTNNNNTSICFNDRHIVNVTTTAALVAVRLTPGAVPPWEFTLLNGSSGSNSDCRPFNNVLNSKKEKKMALSVCRISYSLAHSAKVLRTCLFYSSNSWKLTRFNSEIWLHYIKARRRTHSEKQKRSQQISIFSSFFFFFFFA